MPQASIELLDNVSTLLASAANVFAVAGICSKGDTSRAYTYDPDTPPSTVRTDLGDGKLVEAVITELRYGGRRVVAFPLAVSVAGTLSAVTESEAMPNITLSAIAAAGDVLINGPYDSLSVAIRVDVGGAASTARFSYSLDDQTKGGAHVGTFSGEITVPADQKAEIIGTVDLTTINLASLNTLTAIVTSDTGGPSTCTFTTPTNVADLISQLNTAWSGTATAELTGANKLRVLSVTAGSTGNVRIGNGTANNLLGIVNLAEADGTNATFDIPNTGIRLTFAAGTYVEDGVYTFTSTGPKFASTAFTGLSTRIQAAVSDGALVGAVWPVQDDADAIDARTMLDAFSSMLTAARAAKFFWWGLYGINPSETDANVITRIGTFVDPYIAVCAGGFRAAGGLLPGARYHRSAAWAAAWRAAAERWSSDLGNRQDGPFTSAVGVTELSRDERTAATKLATFRTAQEANGGGFCVLESPSNQSGVFHFYRGRTMAVQGSILGDLASTRLILVSARQVQTDLDAFINADVLTEGGALAPSEADRIEGRVRGNLEVILFADPDFDEKHAVAIGEIVPVLTGNTLSATFEIERRRPIKKITAKLGVTDSLSTLTVNEA
jgi:hypothetical protein